MTGICPRCGAVDSVRPLKVLDGGRPGLIITVNACTECDAVIKDDADD